jgi:aminoglycoside 6'-N-acetyltransferase
MLAAMDTSAPYTFRAAKIADLDLLRDWQRTPHVREWWDDEDPFDAADLADPRIDQWIVSHAGAPFAYMQDYAVHGWDDHPFRHLPAGTRGIDQFIGVPEMIGKGHGTGFIGQRMRELFAEGVPLIVTDPDPRNLRAVAVYRKLGFRPDGDPLATDWGTVQPMVARAPC